MNKPPDASRKGKSCRYTVDLFKVLRTCLRRAVIADGNASKPRSGQTGLILGEDNGIVAGIFRLHGKGFGLARRSHGSCVRFISAAQSKEQGLPQEEES
jgi:hypothetical protein